MTKAEFENKIAVLLGGRAAELAKNMVKSYGMSDVLGAQSFTPSMRPGLIDLSEVERASENSPRTAAHIDDEIRRIVDTQFRRVYDLLASRLVALRRADDQLLQHETISGEDLKRILAAERAA